MLGMVAARTSAGAAGVLTAVLLMPFAGACASSPTPVPPASLAATPTPLVPAPSPAPTQVLLPGVTLPPSIAMRVELAMFSGRPNPAWDILPGQADRLAGLIAALPVVAGNPAQGGLGYQGFEISITTPGGAVRHFTAFAGTVTLDDGNGSHYRRDAAGSVERFLLETGRPFITAAEAKIVEDAITTLVPGATFGTLAP